MNDALRQPVFGDSARLCLRIAGPIAAAGSLLVVAGCGFKGPLYLPEHTATVVTHPAPAAQPPPPANQSQSPPAGQARVQPTGPPQPADGKAKRGAPPPDASPPA